MWLKRSESKAKEEAKDAQIVSLQAKATQDQVETLVEQAQKVVSEQRNTECTPCDRGNINRFLLEQSNLGSTNKMSKGVDAKALLNDTANVPDSTPKAR